MRKLTRVLLVGSLLLALTPALAGGASWNFEYVTKVQNTGEISGMLLHPQGVTTDKFGSAYVVSQDLDVIDVYDRDGTVIHTWATTVGGTGALGDAYDVAVDRWGNIYAVEHATQRVSVYNSAGSFTRYISTGGSDPGELVNPIGIAVDLRGNVYVSDNSMQISKFRTDGTYLTRWDTAGPAFGISCDQDGNVWVANDEAMTLRPDYGNTVMKYSPWGDMLASWGSTGTADGQFDRAYDVSVDGAGRVFALDSQGERVQAFTGDGTFLTSYNGTGSGDLFSIPYGVAAGFMREGWVADYGRNRAVKFVSEPKVPTNYVEIAGGNRYDTAAEAADMGWEQSEYALVATGDNWPDALSGAGLAGAVGAPLLLTDPDSLSPQVASRVVSLGCDQVYVLGGSAAVSDHVFDQLVGIMGPGHVERLGGGNRYETSALIAETAVALKGASFDGTGFVVTGANFPDALAVSPIAAANGWPILLTEPDDVPGVITSALVDNGINHGYVIGGLSAVGADAYDEIDALWIGEPMRISGDTRYQTAAEVAQIGFEGMGMLWSRPAIATGENFPDALAGGVFQGSDCSVMLLTPGGTLDSSAAAALSANKDSIFEMRYLGGTSVVTQGVRDDVQAILH